MNNRENRISQCNGYNTGLVVWLSSLSDKSLSKWLNLQDNSHKCWTSVHKASTPSHTIHRAVLNRFIHSLWPQVFNHAHHQLALPASSWPLDEISDVEVRCEPTHPSTHQSPPSHIPSPFITNPILVPMPPPPYVPLQLPPPSVSAPPPF